MSVDPLVALGIAALLGLRHAADPDHLVAVISLLTAERGGARAAVRLGAWWGLGHATMLLGIGLPLIVFRSELPSWIEGTAETAVGVVILLLAGRLIWNWLREDRPINVRSPLQAYGVGVLHGLAGTGAVVVVLIAALPGTAEAMTALAVFAPMSILSMAGVTGALGWILTRRLVEPVYRTVIVPVLGIAGLSFGLWYVGVA